MGRMVAKEYWGYRYYCAGMSAVDNAAPALKRRMEAELPGAWEDYQRGMELIMSAISRVKGTFSQQEIGKIQREMDGDEIRLVTIGPSRRDMNETDCVYITREQLAWLIDHVIKDECMFCTLKAEKIKNCPTKAALDKLFTYRMPTESGGACIWSSYGSADNDSRRDIMSMDYTSDDTEIIGERQGD